MTANKTKLLILLALQGLFLKSSFAYFTFPQSEMKISPRFEMEISSIVSTAFYLENGFVWKELNEEEKSLWDESLIYPLARNEWMHKRISYIFPHQLDRTYSIFLGSIERTYPFPEKYPTHPYNEFGFQDINTHNGVTSLSPEIYLQGKKNQKLAYFFDNHPVVNKIIPITSPQKGIIQITSKAIKHLDFFPEKISRVLLRGILFHEARHGDGHGKHLGFPHTLCPYGHDYAGQLACDTPSNGSYALQAFYLKKTVEACTECNEYEKEVLRFFQVETKGRVLTTKDKLSQLDQERIYEIENKITELTRSYFDEDDNHRISSISKEIYRLNDELSRIISRANRRKTLILDPSPENILEKDEEQPF